ncbi:MAG: hypothetical protein ACREFA_03390 [Stellaceae bacterium]
MRNGIVVRSSAAQLSRFSASPAIVATTNATLRSSTAEGAMIGTAAAVLLRSDRVGRFPSVRTAAHPALSTGTRTQLSLAAGATRGLPPAAPAPAEPPPATGEERRVAALQEDSDVPPLDKSPGEAETVAAPPALPPPDAPADPSSDAAPATPPVKPVNKPRPIEMAIDSLPNYDLLQPIPVVIEETDDRMFVAQAPALEISAKGSSVGGAFLQLKEQIAATYEQCRQKSTLTPERLRQLGLFQAYIGKARRSWSLGRG